MNISPAIGFSPMKNWAVRLNMGLKCNVPVIASRS